MMNTTCFSQLVLLVISVILPTSVFPQSQVWGWTAGATTPTGYEQANGIATDINGNVIITGYYQADSIDFGSVTLTASPSLAVVSDEIYVAKYTGNGQLLWARSIGSSTSVERGLEVTTDPGGNVIIAGEFSGDSINVSGITLYNHPGYKSDIYLAKYDPSGNILWAIGIGDDLEEIPNALTTDMNGNIYLAGWYASDSLMIGSTMLPAGPGRAALLVKFDSAGNPLMVKTVNGNGPNEFKGVTIDLQGNIIVAGYYYSSTLQIDAVLFTNPAIANGQDGMLIKYDSSGVFQWIKSYGGGGFDESNSISSDTAGNIYTCGSFSGTSFTLEAQTLTRLGQTESFVAKLSPAGNLIWLRSIVGYLNDIVLTGALDANGNYYAGGWFNSLSIASTPLNITRTGTSSSSDAILIRFNSSGTPTSYGQARGSKTSVMAGIAVAPNGRVYTCGYFNGDTLDFGTSMLNNYNSGGTNNLFVAELTFAFTGTDEAPAANNTVTLYPNPAKDLLNIRADQKIGSYRITDVSGRISLDEQNKVAETTSISIGHLSPGLYLIQLEDGRVMRFIRSN